MIRTATTARSGRVVALAAVLTGLVLTLTGCGGGAGSELNGEYYSSEDSMGGQLVIKSGTMTFYRFDCNSNNEAIIRGDASAEGQVTNDGAQVMWNTDDEHLNGDSVGGVTPITLATAGSAKMISIDGYQFVAKNKNQAVVEYGQRC